MHSRDLIEQYKTYVQDWLRYFHKHPELSNEEFETTKTLAKELESMGVEVHVDTERGTCLLYTSPSPRDPKTSRMPSSA